MINKKAFATMHSTPPNQCFHPMPLTVFDTWTITRCPALFEPRLGLLFTTWLSEKLRYYRSMPSQPVS